ncbi:hypothetical protein ABIA31_001229 [Catenulispora sp. MAP5-51]
MHGLSSLNSLSSLSNPGGGGSGEWGTPAPPHAAVSRWNDSGVTMR